MVVAFHSYPRQSKLRLALHLLAGGWIAGIAYTMAELWRLLGVVRRDSTEVVLRSVRQHTAGELVPPLHIGRIGTFHVATSSDE
ncbi:hypothetical protein D3C87_1805490 [compost metagenome]